MTVVSITIDGIITDWNPVLSDPQNCLFDTTSYADADAPTLNGTAGASRDIEKAYWTWDNTNLYVLVKVCDAVQNPTDFLVYMDTNNDGYLSNTDTVADFNFKNHTGDPTTQFADAAALFRYGASTPQTDSIKPDGSPEVWIPPSNMSGNIWKSANGDGQNPDNTSLHAWGVTGKRWGPTSTRTWYEFRAKWTDLNVPVGSPIQFKISATNPGTQPDDNTGPGTSGYTRLDLASDLVTATLPSRDVTFTHTLVMSGNTTDTVTLTARTADGWPTRIVYGGSTVSTLAMSATPTVNDTRTVQCVVSVPANAQVGVAQDVYLTATSGRDTSVLDAVHDQIYPGPLAIYPDQSSTIATGTSVTYAHILSNNSTQTLTVDLTGYSHSAPGWSVQVLGATGSPTSTVVVPANTAVPVSLVVTCPPTAVLGTQDVSEILAAPREWPGFTDHVVDVSTVRPRIELKPDNSLTGNAGQVFTYAHTLTNNNVTTDTISIAAASSISTWTVALYSSDGFTANNTFTVGPHQSTTVYARVSVPFDAAPSTAVATLTATSGLNAAYKDTAVDRTTIVGMQTYSDPGMAVPESIFRLGETTYIQASGLIGIPEVYFRVFDASSTVVAGASGAASSTTVSDGMSASKYKSTTSSTVGTYNAYVYNKSTNATISSVPFKVTYDASITDLHASAAATPNETITISSTLSNRNAVPIPGSSAKYTVWLDVNLDGVFDAGDTWVDGSGNIATWNGSGSPVTHTSTVSVPATGSAGDSWGVTNKNFPIAGTYQVTETWTTNDAVFIDSTTSSFYSPGGPWPDMSVSKQFHAGQASVVASGDPVVFDLVVRNSGDTTLNVVPLRDTFKLSPADFTFTTSTPAPTSPLVGNLYWSDITTSLGDIEPGKTATVTVTLVAVRNGTLVNSLTSTGSVDSSGVPLPSATSTLAVTADVTPAGTMKVNEDAAYTTTTTVSVDSTVTNAATMRVSVDGGSTWSGWVAYAPHRTETLPSGDGTKTVVTEYKSAGGSTIQITDTIILDTTVPVTSASPAPGASSTGTITVTLWVVETGTAPATRWYKLDGGSATTYGSPFDITTEGTHTVEYWSVDGAGNVEGSHTLSVNISPVAAADSATTAEDTTATIDVLANDTTALSNPMTIDLTGATAPSHGTVSVVAGKIEYVPAANYNGPDSFTYRVKSGTAYSGYATVSVTVTAVNDAPVANDDTATTAEDTTATIDVLANDTDVDGDSLTIDLTGATAPSHGAVSVVAGKIRYVPAVNYNGSDSFTYRVFDGTAYSNYATVSLTVTAVNDAPVAFADSATIAEDASATIDVLANDTDVDGDSLSISLAGATAPSHGSVSVVSGKIVYTPDANYNGPDSFTYRAYDGTAYSNYATVSLTVTPANDAPVAVNDSATLSEDTTAAIDVLANDTDVDGDALTAEIVLGPSHGTAVWNATTKKVDYTPNADFNGLDSFTYRVWDGTSWSVGTAIVSITVTPVNDAPVAVNDAATTAEDATATIDVLANDTDIDGDSLTISLAGGTAPSHGSISVVAGKVRYVPDANYNGSDSFTYRAYDGTAYSTYATVDITVTAVNDAPVAIDDSATLAEDASATIDVLANDMDVDGDSLTIDLTGATAPSHGSVSVVSGKIVYTPDANYNGSDSFTYRDYDGTAYSGYATVDVAVTAVNDAPTAVDDAYLVDEDTTLTVAAPGVLGNDTDVDGDSLTASVTVFPAHGTLTLNADGSFDYRADANYNGPDSFEYAAGDGSLWSAATVDITVKPVNDAPIAVDDSATLNQDASATIDVLANDSDVDGDGLTIDLTGATAPSHGSVSIVGGKIVYTPDAGYKGPDSFTYRAFDGTTYSGYATVDVTVTAVNAAPVAVDDSATLAEDASATIDVLANDADVDGNSLSISLTGATAPSHGSVSIVAGKIVYTPDANYNGSDSFTYRAFDGALYSDYATVDVTVTAVNDAPVAVNDSATLSEDTTAAIDVLANDTDVDGDMLTAAAVVSPPSHGVAVWNTSTLTFDYAPDADYHGLDSFTYRVFDGTAWSVGTALVNITVTSVNDAPVANPDTYTIAEDTTLTVVAPGVLGNDTDVDGDSLTASVTVFPAHGSLTLNADGSFEYRADANYNGPDSFEYAASDGSLSSTATVSLSVTAVNDAPVAIDDSATLAEDTSATIDVLATDTDVEGDSLTIDLTGATAPSHGSISIVSGKIVYTPDANYNGSDSFTYRAYDGTAYSGYATVSLTVTAVNDAPVAVIDSAITDEGVSVSIDVLANDTDVDGDSLSVDLTGATAPDHGSVSIVAGKVDYTPDPGYGGLDTFTYRAFDGTAYSTYATVNVGVADKTGPIVTATPSPAWTSSATVSVSLDTTATDIDYIMYAIDGGPWQLYDPLNPPTFSADGVYTIDYYGVDVFGNEGPTGTGTVTIDKTGPIVTAMPSPAWTASTTVEVSLDSTATDLDAIYYSVDGGTYELYDALNPPTFSADGVYTLDFYGIDTMGNVGPIGTETVTIDTTPPTTTGPTLSGMYGGPVEVALEATDTGVGVDTTYYSVNGGPLQSYSTTVTISADGPYTVSFFSVDKLGNVEPVNSVSFVIDTTQPAMTVTKTANRHSAQVGDYIDYTITVHNGGTGVAKSVVVTDTWSPVVSWVSATGDFTGEVHGSTDATFTLADLAVGADAVINVRMQAVALGSAGNAAAVSALDKLGNPVTGSGDSTAPVVTAPALGLTASLAPGQDATVQAGQPVTFAFRLTNSGDTTITSGLVPVSWNATWLQFDSSSAAGSIGSDSATFTVPVLNPGESATITVTFTALGVPPAHTTSVGGSTASVTDENGDPVAPATDSTSVAITAPGFSASKSLAPGQKLPIRVGDTVKFVISGTNTGDTDLASAALCDQFDPTMLEYVSATPDAVETASGCATFTTGPLAQGESFTATVTMKAIAEGDTFNDVIASADDVNGDPATSTASVGMTTLPAVHPVLEVTKVLAQGQDTAVQVGQSASYDIVLHNSGDSTVSAGSIRDHWDPADLQFVSASPSADAVGSGEATWSVPTLLPGESATITVDFKVLSKPVSGHVSNSADATGVVDAEGYDVVTGGDTVQLAVTAPAVSVSKALAPWQSAQVYNGDPVAYRVTVTNSGDTTLTTVPLDDEFDAAYLDFGSASITPDTIGAGTLSWNDVADLAPGESVSVGATFTAKALPSGLETTNTATVTGATDVNGDTAKKDSASATVAFNDPGVSITKELAAEQTSTVVIGEPVDYDIVVKNAGTTTLTSVRVTDDFPVQLAFDHASVTPDTVGSGQVVWNDITDALGDLAPGEVATITARFVAVSSGDATNGAAVDATDIGGHDLPTETTTNGDLKVSGMPMATLLKSSVPTAGTVVMPGDTITYKLAFENPTNVALRGVLITDTVPFETSYNAGTTKLFFNGATTDLTDAAGDDAGTFDAPSHTVRVEIPMVAAHASGYVTFSVTVKPADISRPGVFNSFTLTQQQLEPSAVIGDPVVQHSNVVTHPVDPFDIVKTAKDLNGGKLQSGDVIEWKIVVTNTGLIPTTHVVVTDPLQKGITYVAGSIRGKGANDKNPRKLVWDIGSMPVGGREVLSFRSTLDSGLKPGTTIANHATVDSAETAAKSSDDPRTRAQGDSTLVRTGDNDWIWLVSAIVLMVAGIALLSRRRIREFGRWLRTPATLFGMSLLVAGLLVVAWANVDEIAYAVTHLGSDAGISSLEAPAATAGTTRDVAGYRFKGAGDRLAIPSLGLDMPIGTNEAKALVNGVWLHAGSARPGESGNVALAGHRRHGVFTLLHRIKIGSIVVVRWKGTVYRYKVASSKIISPKDTGYLVRGGRDRVTMYTCIPRFLGNERRVVVAYPIGSTATRSSSK